MTSTVEKALFVPLARGPFRAFWDGVKTVEVRQAKLKWHPGQVFEGRPVTLRYGYAGTREVRGVIGRVGQAANIFDVPEWARTAACLKGHNPAFYDPNEKVIYFEVLNPVRWNQEDRSTWRQSS